MYTVTSAHDHLIACTICYLDQYVKVYYLGKHLDEAFVFKSIQAAIRAGVMIFANTYICTRSFWFDHICMDSTLYVLLH